MSVTIEDITNQAAPDVHAAEVDAEDDAFHDADGSEDSFEDAADHFDAESLDDIYRAQAAAVAAGRAHSDTAADPSDPFSRQPFANDSAATPAAPPSTVVEQQTTPQHASTSAEGNARAAHSGRITADASDSGAGEPEAGSAAAEGEQPESDAAPIETLSEEEIQRRTSEAEELKQQGNGLFGEQKFEEAQAKYSEALDAAPPSAPQRAVYFANRAAAALKLRQWSNAASDCTAALAIDDKYLKAYLRRAVAYEEADDLERCLADYQKASGKVPKHGSAEVLELEPANAQAAQKVKKLEPIVLERREKMKEEMIGKMKDLGNTILGKFGMSLDNFRAVKDPNTGSYSINFQQ